MKTTMLTMTMLIGLAGQAFAGTGNNESRAQRVLEGAFSGAVERELIQNLGNLKSEFSNNWGNTIKTPNGTTTEKYKIYGPRNPLTGKRTWTWGYRPAVKYAQKNHGQWTKGWVRLENARDEFDIKFRNFRKTSGKKEIRFQIFARGMFRGQAEYRSYSHGAKLVSVTANGRARCNIYLNMRVYIYNNGTRIGWEVESADIKYSDVVLDKIGKAGGTTARLLGDAFTGAVKQWFPQKERDAIAKAKQAVSKSIKGNQRIKSDLAKIMKMF